MRQAIAAVLLVIATIAFAPVLSGTLGCSGSSDNPANLEEAMLQYEEGETVRFKLSGEADCNSCDPDEIAGLYVELVSRLSPTTNLTVGTFDGLGPFYFPNLMAVPGSTVDVYGILFYSADPDAPGRRAEASFTVPDEDGKTAAITLRFD